MIDKRDDKISYLERELSNERDCIADLLKSESELKKDLALSESFCKSAAADYEAAKAEYETEIGQLRCENDHKFAAMCRLREEIADGKTVWSNSQTRVMELEFENRALRNDIEEYRDYIKDLQADTQFGV